MPTAHELGTPVRSLNWVRIHPGRTRDGRPSLLASMGQDNGGFFVCDIDLATGHCTQYPVNLKHASFPTASYRNPESGVLYVGSAYTGHLHRFDPNLPADQRRLEDLGKIDPELANFPCRIDESPDGFIWIGAYGGCSLTRFDPRDNTFKRFGRMDDTDQYGYVHCGSDGTVAVLVKMCRVHTVLVDPQTGEKREVGPSIETNEPGAKEKAYELFKGEDGLLYIKSFDGNFRLRGMTAEPVASVPAPAPVATLPDGTMPKLTDAAAQIFRSLELTKGDSKRTLHLDWVGEGTNLFLIHAGPDGKIYGSSILPEHLFRCDADGSGMIDLGQCSISTGEAYSMGNFDGRLYIASYPGARLSIYDPSKRYRFGEDPEANPRDIGRLDQVAYRPRTMVAGPLGKVWVGSVPDYGMWGGTLAVYDPATGQTESHRHILKDANVTALEWLPQREQFIVGTSIHGGSGTTPRISEAAFVFWDAKAGHAAATENFGIKRLEGIMDLLRVDDEHVYAVAAHIDADNKTVPQLLLLDVVHMAVIDRTTLGGDHGWPLEVSLRRGPEGAIYGATSTEFYRIAAGTTRRDVLWSTPIGEAHGDDFIRVSGPIVGRRWYFASGHRLRCIDIP